ncbi:SDR family NAD(P)-dependent oxidoreductase [Paenibacillus sp. J2TS4]|uniref:SDR family NAD(P)-dependent oxidoreductase n=1 Tax=Paenibacillus sp. J2TS4 TaxID=2807194 RepID=UPI001AFE5411|nr:SDR family NAD(P)-dependent oxidoreductase [Paenibacillus sp. J2TS4]GIP36080.1 hypothetical protein J2TS4_52900 [Paenibacillus sp. J2TS4]
MTNRVALVKGAGTGLGQATAIQMAADGAEVVLTGRRKETLQETAQMIEQAGGRSIVLSADVTKPIEASRLREQLGSFNRDGLMFLIDNKGDAK